MKNLVNKAVSDYNPAEDGDDFDKYFAQKMNDQGFPTFTKLNDLNSDAQRISGDAQTLLSNIQLQAGVVSSAKLASDAANNNLNTITDKLNNVITEINSNNTEISGLQSTLETKETRKTEVQKEIDILNPVEGGGMTAAEVLAKVPQKEKDFAKEKGVNLEDCLIMQAADGDWHIYIMSEKDGYYKSV